MTIEKTIDIQPNRRLEIDLPFDLPLGKAKVEITITPEKKINTSDGKSAFGCLNTFANPAKIPGENGAWARAVIEKHAKN